MATIVAGGPVGRARSAVSGQVCRVAALVAGLVMVLPVFHIEPGTARQVCAVTAAVLLIGATLPRRPTLAPARHEVATTADIAELERELLRVREDVERRAEAFGDRLDLIADLVVEIGDQVR